MYTKDTPVIVTVAYRPYNGVITETGVFNNRVRVKLENGYEDYIDINAITINYAKINSKGFSKDNPGMD